MTVKIPKQLIKDMKESRRDYMEDLEEIKRI